MDVLVCSRLFPVYPSHPCTRWRRHGIKVMDSRGTRLLALTMGEIPKPQSRISRMGAFGDSWRRRTGLQLACSIFGDDHQLNRTVQNLQQICGRLLTGSDPTTPAASARIALSGRDHSSVLHIRYGAFHLRGHPRSRARGLRGAGAPGGVSTSLARGVALSCASPAIRNKVWCRSY